MFDIKDLESQIKAPIFGVWATKGGREYWDKRQGKKAKSIDANSKKEWLKQFRKKIHGNKGNKEEWLKQFRERIGR